MLLLGVEDSGEVTGLHENHRDLDGLASLIANRTNPSLAVNVHSVQLRGMEIARIQVSKARQLIATSEGVLQRRRMMANGKPEAVPF